MDLPPLATWPGAVAALTSVGWTTLHSLAGPVLLIRMVVVGGDRGDRSPSPPLTLLLPE
jgi:hypothetical protein